MRVKMARRQLWLGLFTGLLLLGAGGYRLFQLQMMERVDGRDLVKMAYDQQNQSLPLQMRRGRILDRNGVELTAPETSYAVGLFPRAMGELDDQALARLFTPREVDLIARARRSPVARWVITQGISAKRGQEIQAVNLPGIVLGETGSRYGGQSLARHLVGYANDLGGQLGLEKAFEEQLRGDRVPHLVASFDGRNRLLHGAIRTVQPLVGKEPYDLHTTIDARIQQAVEREMDQTAPPAGHIFRGAVVVLDAKSGDPLAIASRPDFTQTSLPPANQELYLWNRALTAYEPGSVFKPLVAAAAMEAGALSLDEVLDCPAQYNLGGIRFKNFDGKGHGQIPFREALARSCNTTLIQIGYERLGAEKLLEAARRFGLGRATGLYPGAAEDKGRLPRLQYGGDVAQFSFGQGGLMATPLQVARAYAAIANDGVLPPVRLVTTVRTPDGEVIERLPAEEPRRVISRETAGKLQEALRAVTEPGGVGTGRAAWAAAGGSAGKTGSAETVQNGEAITHAWFAGWVPARAPRYVIVVFIEDGQSGGAYAAPLFRRIAEGIMNP